MDGLFDDIVRVFIYNTPGGLGDAGAFAGDLMDLFLEYEVPEDVTTTDSYMGLLK